MSLASATERPLFSTPPRMSPPGEVILNPMATIGRGLGWRGRAGQASREIDCDVHHV